MCGGLRIDGREEVGRTLTSMKKVASFPAHHCATLPGERTGKRVSSQCCHASAHQTRAVNEPLAGAYAKTRPADSGCPERVEKG